MASQLDTLRDVAVHLNSQSGRGEVGISELGLELGLEWEEVYSIIQIIRAVNETAPTISEDTGTIEVEDTKPQMQFDSPLGEVLGQVFVSARLSEGDMLEDIPSELNKRLRDEYPDTLDDAAQLGLVEYTDDSISLTPRGLGYIGPELSARMSPSVTWDAERKVKRDKRLDERITPDDL